MIGVERLRVSIFLGDQETEIGELVLARNRVYFKFSNSFLEKGIEISPFKMKLTTEIISADQLPFDGLFGVFNDSLPGGLSMMLSPIPKSSAWRHLMYLPTTGTTIARTSPF